MCSDRLYWKYTGWAKVCISPYSLPVSGKIVRISLQYIDAYLKRGNYMFELTMKCLWCKIRYLHKLCCKKTSKWQVWKDLAVKENIIGSHRNTHFFVGLNLFQLRTHSLCNSKDSLKVGTFVDQFRNAYSFNKEPRSSSFLFLPKHYNK